MLWAEARPTHPTVSSRARTNARIATSIALKTRGEPVILVRSRRLELPRSFPHSDLNAARLPIPPRPHAGAPNRAGLRLANSRYHIKRVGSGDGDGNGW